MNLALRKLRGCGRQNSIRKLSDPAFAEILFLAKVELDFGKQASLLEKNTSALSLLAELNNLYSSLSPKDRAKRVQKHIDRGTSITNALKSLLGSHCQICNWSGFTKKNDDVFIEAHHIVQLYEKKEGSLCTENIILVCPNCHREIHYGKVFQVIEYEDLIEIELSTKKARIKKNTMEYLSSRKG